MTKRQVRYARENRIERIYAQRCSGIAIPIMKIGDVFKVAERAIDAGADDQALGDAIRQYVDTIR